MKKVLISIFLSLCFIWILCIIFGYTFVFISEYPNNMEYNFNKGDTVNVLDSLDFSNGVWCSYLIISRSDFGSLDERIPKKECLKLDDIKILKKIQNNWQAIYSGGDIATVQSSIIFLQNGNIKFESGIILDKNLGGLQSKYFGFIEFINEDILLEYFKKYKPVYWPILIL